MAARLTFVSVVVPVYNERDSVRPLTGELLAALRGSRAAVIGDSEVERVVAQVLGEIDSSAAQVSEVRSLRDLVEELG